MIYFLKIGRRHVKVGYSENVAKRIEGIESGWRKSPRPEFRLLGVIPGDRRFEQEILRMFADLLEDAFVQGYRSYEIFRYESPIREWIDRSILDYRDSIDANRCHRHWVTPVRVLGWDRCESVSA